MQQKRFFQLLVCSFFLCLFYQCRQVKEDGTNQSNKVITDSIPLPFKSLLLENDRGKVFYIDSASVIGDTLIDSHKQKKVSGDVFFKITGGQFPQYLYTTLMQLTILQPSEFRVSAYDADQGQSVESLTGEIKIAKNYASPFPEPDTLHENNLYMVNRSIDLSEKENLDDDKLAKWWERVDKVNSNQ